MNFLDDMSRKISRGTKTIAQKSSELIEITKIKLSIASEKDRIGRLYEEMGETLYEDYKRGNTMEKHIMDKCKAIDEINNRIYELNCKAMNIKGGAICGECGGTIQPHQQYCHDCGRDQGGCSRIVEEGDDFKVEVQNGTVCDKCGALAQEGAVFCPACGERMQIL